MTRALDAYREGRYDEARSHLAEAEQFRPGAPEVASALELVEEGELQAVISQLHQEALEHEAQEQWQAAWNDYRQVLAIDPAIQFAQEGKLRSEAMILLEKRTSQYLANPDLLIQVGSREEAKAFVQQLQGTANLGPKLSEAAAQLAALVRLANTPLRVSLQSDEKTEVAVYRVGRYGAFKNLDLDLLPGVYTVIGQRDGYKDVRLTLRLEPGAQGTAMRVVCSERI